jgi:DNA-binding NtrC family response regulator
VVEIASPATLRQSFAGLRVLVIDDDALVRGATQGMLEAWGAQVSFASSLREVSALTTWSDIDLVICDYRLPEGDGIKIYEYIQSISNKMPPFILISGDHGAELLQQVEQRKIRLLQKPVRPAKLRSLIQFLVKEADAHE